ncbi:MAG TPA: site-specific integrase [Candidatus Acidoferrum sp.]|nr:site-specific integrase [Candidatus Acidoferrum sp.]
MKTDNTNNRWKFTVVKDSRGREIEGLYVRNGRYYVALRLPLKGVRRICLLDKQNQPIRDAKQAADAAVQMRQDKREGVLPAAGQAPRVRDYATDYIQWCRDTEAKDPKTIKNEERNLERWVKAIGHTRINHITVKQITDFVKARKAEKRGDKPISTRTVNLDVMSLHNMLTHAQKKDGWIIGDPVTKNYEALPYKPQVRSLVSTEDFERVYAELLRRENDTPVYSTGQLCVDWLKFMCFSGARKGAAVKAKWAHVDWKNKQLHLDTKYKKHVIVDFNPRLEAHLLDMASRRLPDAEWIFPSPRGIAKDGHVLGLQNTLHVVRQKVGFPRFSPHDCRHHFISYAVMEGIDYMTIARWVGHADGGVLIGKVYGHLAPGHAKKMAAQFSFGARPTEAPPATPIPASQNKTAEQLSVSELLALVQQKVAREAGKPDDRPAEKTPAPPQP